MTTIDTSKPNTNRPVYSGGPKTGYNRNSEEVESFLKDLHIFSLEKSKKIKKPIVEFVKTAAEFVTKYATAAVKQVKTAMKHLKF